MTWAWKHWMVKCRNCTWFTQYFPPDQKHDAGMEQELQKTVCPDCKGHTRVRWVG